MRIGLHALGIGEGARRDVIDAAAATAESAGFVRLWAGEHLVMVDSPASRYPYAADGRIGVPAAADWLDPMICLSFAAAATSTIGLATGVTLLPEHHPIVVAKQAASLDVLSGGRFTLGVGVGWSAEEFAALGVPFRARGRRTAEYVSALRTIWREDVATFHGEFVSFEGVRVNPKPFQGRSIPVIVGGNSDAALNRVAGWADGWYGFNLDGPEDVAARLAYLHQRCREHDRERGSVYCAVALRDPRPSDVSALVDLGVDELVLVESPSPGPAAVREQILRLADEWQNGGHAR